MNRAFTAIACFVTAIWIVVQTVRLAADDAYNLLFGLFALEFLSLHSGAWITLNLRKGNDAARRKRHFAVVFSLYGLFAYAYAVSAGPQLLYAYVFLMAGRFADLLLESNEEKWDHLRGRSGNGIVLLPISVFVLIGVRYFAPFLLATPAQYWCAILAIYFVGMGLLELLPEKYWRTQEAE